MNNDRLMNDLFMFAIKYTSATFGLNKDYLKIDLRHIPEIKRVIYVYDFECDVEKGLLVCFYTTPSDVFPDHKINIQLLTTLIKLGE